MISSVELLALSPDNCFIAIAKNVGAAIRAMPGFLSGGYDDDDFLHMRNIVTASVVEGHIVTTSVVIYDPPRPQKHGYSGKILAEFDLAARMVNDTMYGRLCYHCRLVTGSPKGNLPYTLILSSVEEVTP